MPKVSVIIPIYNVEKYITRCAKSLFNQTLEDIEYIFVNDCTPDKSIELLNGVIECYPHRKSQIKILQHKENKGLAAVRNTGLEASTGDYIIHCDSDDWVEPEMYEEMYSNAIENESDIVICDFIVEKHKISEYIKHNPEKNPRLFIKSLLNQTAHGNSWAKLVKKSIFVDHQLTFTKDIDMWEDFVMANKLFYFSNKISYIHKAFYHYNRTNPNSYVSCYTTKSLNEMVKAVCETENFFKSQNCFEEYKTEIEDLKIKVKYYHFKYGDKHTSKLAISLFSELNDNIYSSTLKKTRQIRLSISIKYPPLLPLLRKL